MITETARALGATGIFGALAPEETEAIAKRSGTRSCDAGELLFNEGEPCRGLYIVMSGRVQILKTSAGGREHILAVEGPGSSIAELPVFDGGAYPASARAAEPSRVLFLSREDFRAVCLENPAVALKVLAVVGARLRRLVGIIEELSFTTVRHRLISWLLRRAREEGRQGRDGRVTFSLSSSHQELASQIGTVRELVSRNLSRLQQQGLIEMDGREITIPDAEALEADLASVI